MNEIIKLILEYQQNKREYDFEKIVMALKDKIRYYCKKVPHYYEEDIRQELLMNLYQGVCHFKMNKFNIPKEVFVNKVINKNRKNLYFHNFFKICGTDIFKIACNNVELRKKLDYEYMLYCNEKQFNFYINRGFNFTIKYFLRKNVYKNDGIISLNSMLENNQELIETIADTKNTTISAFDKYELSVKDEEFLKLFIQKERILTEMEVAKELGITQQAVHKKKKKIIENHKNSKKN